MLKNLIFKCLQAQHIHSMFPDVPMQAITLDLAETRSISLTVEHILNNAIYIPDTTRRNSDLASTLTTPTHSPQVTFPHHPLGTYLSQGTPSQAQEPATHVPDSQEPLASGEMGPESSGSSSSETASQTGPELCPDTSELRQRKKSGVDWQSGGNTSRTVNGLEDSVSVTDETLTQRTARRDDDSQSRASPSGKGSSSSSSSQQTGNCTCEDYMSFSSLQRRKRELLSNARRYALCIYLLHSKVLR